MADSGFTESASAPENQGFTRMNTVLFDTLKMVETLQAGGFTDQQARAMTSALGDAATVAAVATRSDVMDLGIGMKHDFETFKIDMKHDFDAFKIDMKHDFDAFKIDVKHDLAALEQRMTIKMGGMLVVLAGLLTAVFHYLR